MKISLTRELLTKGVNAEIIGENKSMLIFHQNDDSGAKACFGAAILLRDLANKFEKLATVKKKSIFDKKIQEEINEGE